MKRTAWIFTLVFTVFLLFAPHLNLVAAQTWRNSPFGAEYDAADSGEVNAGAYTDRTVKGNMASLSCMIMPVLGVCTDDSSKLGGLMKKSAVASLGNYLSLMYSNPPADLALWVRDAGQSLGFLPKPTYAQGIGFSGLSALLPLWKAFRNIAYLLLAIVMVVIGFMVMFRKKIDPKTVVTVQNALPRIVITLLLITFSYAIVGLMIDLMYLGMLFVINVLVAASGGILSSDTATKYIGGNGWLMFRAMFGGGFSSLDDLIRLLNPGATWGSSQFNWWSFPSGVVSGTAEAILLIVILSLALLFSIIRIFFMLLNSYIQIIIALLLGPLQLLLEAFPGSTAFSSWLKNLLANIIVFPITAALILIGTILTQSNILNLWAPPLLVSGGTNGVPALIGLGILMIIPTIVNGIKENLKAKPVIPAGAGAVFAPMTGAVQTAMGTASQFYYGASVYEFIKRMRADKK